MATVGVFSGSVSSKCEHEPLIPVNLTIGDEGQVISFTSRKCNDTLRIFVCKHCQLLYGELQEGEEVEENLADLKSSVFGTKEDS